MLLSYDFLLHLQQNHAKIAKFLLMKNRHDIIWLNSTDSTNNEAKRRLSEFSEVTAVASRHQSAGRGQRGNTWTSNAGENLTFTIVLPDMTMLRAEEQFSISQIAALSIVDFLSEHEIEAHIKWPNDIYAGTRKICGILIENSLRGDRIGSSIVGIGINVNQTSFDPEIPNPTSMVLQNNAHIKYNIEECLASIFDIFKAYLKRYMNITGGLAKLDRLYTSQLWRIEQEQQFIDLTTDPAIEFTGIIKGVTPLGRLKVQMNEGGLKEFAFKEISYILD